MGNEQGGHYFMSLVTGCHLIHSQWMELPMPNNAVACIGELGHHQKMPKTLTSMDHFGFKLPDVDDKVDDEHDSNYEPDDDNASKDDSTISLVPSTHLSDDKDMTMMISPSPCQACLQE
jgi:hypothetical protein